MGGTKFGIDIYKGQVSYRVTHLDCIKIRAAQTKGKANIAPRGQEGSRAAQLKGKDHIAPRGLVGSVELCSDGIVTLEAEIVNKEETNGVTTQTLSQVLLHPPPHFTFNSGSLQGTVHVQD